MGCRAATFQAGVSRHQNSQGGALAEFNTEWTNPPLEDEPDEEGLVPGTTASDRWTMHFDGGFSSDGAGAGVVLTSPTGDKLYYAV